MKRACALLLSIAAALKASAEQPSAPHGFALLAGRVNDEAARARLRSGLADSRPWVRAAAVRVINVSGVAELLPAIVSALAQETDGDAASEMIRFLTALNRPELDTPAIEAARRLGSPVHLALADGLARRGAAASSQIATLRALGVGDDSWSLFYPVATAGAGPGAGALGAEILKEENLFAWRQLLAALRRAEGHLDDTLAVAGVRAAKPEIRAETYWHLAFAYDPSKPQDEALATALGETPEAAGAASVPVTTALAFEILQRLRGRPPRTQIQAFDLHGPVSIGVPLDVVRTRRVVQVLDKSERKMLANVLFRREEALENLPDVPAGRRVLKVASGYSRIETVGGFPARYVADVIQATGCGVKGWGHVLGGEVSYDADGRPRGFGLIPDQKGSQECLEAVRALLVSTLVPLGVPARTGEKALLLVPDQSAFLACLDEAKTTPPERSNRAGAPSTAGSSGGHIEPPRKVRDVPPTYPKSAKARHAQGVAVLEATISPSGCVQGVSLLVPQDSDLDLEALRVVSGWVYTPTLLNGQAVPVLMTVTVNFRLN